MHLSGHGGTLTGYMAGIETKIDYGPEFASHITVELFKDRKGDFWVNFFLNDQKMNVGGVCVEGDCPYQHFVTYLESRMIEGNVIDICMGRQYMDIGEPSGGLGA